jgi:hypothetical protein
LDAARCLIIKYEYLSNSVIDTCLM